jgi:hypothetical protein
MKVKFELEFVGEVSGGNLSSMAARGEWEVELVKFE